MDDYIAKPVRLKGLERILSDLAEEITPETDLT